MKFSELITEPRLLKAVAELGWQTATPIQSKAIPAARDGQDVVGIAQTGTGKTAAFMLPALARQIDREGLHTLVLCPTRELAQQVAEDARALARHTELWIGEIVGGMPMRPQIRDLRAGFDVIVATPGRLNDHIERGNVDLSAVEVLVLDEADRMLDMGFRPQIESILRQLPTHRQTLLFSATMPNGVHALALRILRDPVWVEAARSATVADNLAQTLYSVRTEKKPDLLIELLKQTHWEQVLVFTSRKTGADLLVSRLKSAGIEADVMHGDKDMKQRRRALDAFTNGHVQVLVATDVAQRGLDIEGISHVVNYDVPQDADDYVHRIGRTGRAGASGTAVTFMAAHEISLVRDIERRLGAELPRISLPGFDYESNFIESARPVASTAKVGRNGSRMGTRRPEELSPEELKKLLKVG
ncbi:MAG TPA: DEAD/DEAH box helicase [Longimicrobiales bacterium]|nr:DEAD/DEAH box helicase [Longimicrobiales bacterium]